MGNETEPFGNKETDVKEVVVKKQPKVGARINDQEGKPEKKRRAIDLGISDILLPPITRNATATYRVVNVGAINPATKEPQDPTPVMLPGSYVYYDKGEQDLTKRTKLMLNVTRQSYERDDKTGAQHLVDEVEMVVMPDGVLKVDPMGQYRLYCFMELYPGNISNRNRPKGATNVFERIDLKSNKNSAFKLAAEELQDDAVNVVRKLVKRDEIIALATSANISTFENGTTRDIALIKSDLRAFAVRDPRGFFSLSKNFKASIRIDVLDAISVGFIEFRADAKAFFDYETDQRIHTVIVDEDPTESLIDFMMEDEKGKIWYKDMMNKLDYWEK